MGARRLSGQGDCVCRWLSLLGLLILPFLFATVGAAAQSSSPPPRAVDGVLDLRHWDFRRDTSLPLEGDWQFWRDRLLTSNLTDENSLPPALLAVPGRWSNQQVDGRPLQSEGTGTYHLRVLLPPDAPPLALRHNQRFVAWNVLVNGSRAVYAGTVGYGPDSTDSVGQKAIGMVTPVDGVLDITVQVAAFGGYGGMPRALELGHAEAMYQDWEWELVLRSAFLSLCLSIGILYLILFLLRPRDRQCLVFAIMSLSIGMVQLTANTPLGNQLVGFMPGRVLGLLNNVMFPAVWISALVSAALMFPGAMRRALLWPTIIIIATVPIVSFWTLAYPSLLTATATLGLVMALGTLLDVTITATRRRDGLALPMALAWGVMGAANLALVHRVGFTGVMEAGYCFMLFLQAALLIDRLRRLLDQATQANERLAALNEALEDQVIDRTRHLTETVDRLRLAQDRLVQSEKLASLGRLVAGVAHEVNTPVGTALTTATHLTLQVEQADQAMRDGTLTRRQLAEFLAETREASGLITSVVARAAAVVQSFKLAVADRTDDRLRRFDVAELLADMRPAMEARLQGADIELAVESRPGLLVENYAGALTQVMGQLLTNSLDHAFPLGCPGRIRVVAGRTPEGDVELTLEDNGTGIAPEVKPRLFEPFVTTSRADGRTGMGLHMVYTLVAGRLRGTISITDRPGGGTRATVRLPGINTGTELSGEGRGMSAIIT